MNRRRKLPPLARTYLMVAVGVACLAGWLWGATGLLATGAGLVLGAVNLWAIARLARRAVRDVETGTPGATFALVGGLLLKMVGLFVLAWIAVSVLHLGVLPFALGFSALVLSLVLSGGQAFAREEAV